MSNKIIIIIIVHLFFGLNNMYSQNRTFAQKSNDNAIDLIMVGKYKDALVEINRALKIDPNNANYYYIRGNAYQGLNELTKAIDNYKLTLVKNPRHTDAIMKCGIVYGKLNDKKSACKYFILACNYGEQKGCEISNKFCN
jgi:tetratricopeptide (TPR) repeat protein